MSTYPNASINDLFHGLLAYLVNLNLHQKRTITWKRCLSTQSPKSSIDRVKVKLSALAPRISSRYARVQRRAQPQRSILRSLTCERLFQGLKQWHGNFTYYSRLLKSSIDRTKKINKSIHGNKKWAIFTQKKAKMNNLSHYLLILMIHIIFFNKTPITHYPKNW